MTGAWQFRYRMRWAGKFWGLDTRGILLFRILLCCYLFFDLFDRALDLEAHYTDLGVFPRDIAFATTSNYVWSFLFMSGSPAFAAFIFLAEIVAILFLLVGYYTTLSCIIIYILHYSIIYRNVFVNHSGDDLLRNVIMIFVFLPLGRSFSVDAGLVQKKRKKYPNDKVLYSVPTFYLVLQVFLMYYISTLFKTGDPWVKDFDASRLAVQFESLQMPFGKLLVDIDNYYNGEFLQLFTQAVFYWELLGSLLFFSPFLPDLCRGFACLGFMCLHAGFGLALRLEGFFYFPEIVLLCMMPSFFWDFILAPFKKLFHHQGEFHVVLNENYPRIVPLLTFLLEFSCISPLIVDVESTSADWYIRVRRVEAYKKDPSSDKYNLQGVFLLSMHSPTLAGLGLLIPFFLKSPTVTEKIEAELCVREAPPPKQDKKWRKTVWKYTRTIIPCIFICLALIWNAFMTGHLQEYSHPLHLICYGLGVNQNWGVFAPSPPTTLEWFVVIADKPNGSQVEIWGAGNGLHSWEQAERPVIWEPDSLKPGVVLSHLYNHRWIKYYEQVGKSPIFIRGMLSWYCRSAQYYYGEESYSSLAFYSVLQTYGKVGQPNLLPLVRHMMDMNCTDLTYVEVQNP